MENKEENQANIKQLDKLMQRMGEILHNLKSDRDFD